MRALKFAGVVAYGKLHPIRAAGLVGMPYWVYMKAVNGWSEHGHINIDGWDIDKCSECGAPVIRGEKHACLKRINRKSKKKRAKPIDGKRTCEWCGKSFEVMKNGAGAVYCCRDCATHAQREQNRRHLQKMYQELKEFNTKPRGVKKDGNNRRPEESIRESAAC